MLKDVLKSKPNVDVVKLQKSGGVVSRNPKVRQKARGNRIRVMIPLFHVTEIYIYIYILYWEEDVLADFFNLTPGILLWHDK